MKTKTSPFVLFYYVVFQYSFEEPEFSLDDKEKKIESLHFVNFDLYKDWKRMVKKKIINIEIYVRMITLLLVNFENILTIG